MNLQGKVALVTGASSGIGEAIAVALAQAGATLVLTARDETRLAAVQQRCGAGAWTFKADVADEMQVVTLAAAVHARHPAVDILVNNAGVVMSGLLVDVEPGDWKRLHDINVMGVVHGCRAFVPRMIERGGGHVVNMASVAGIVGAYGMSTYAATKFAVVGLSEALRFELKRHGIGVSAICPGYVDTPIAAKVKVVGKMDNERTRAAIDKEFKQNSVTPDVVAAQTLQAIRRNRALVTVGRDASLARWMKRISPALLERALER